MQHLHVLAPGHAWIAAAARVSDPSDANPIPNLEGLDGAANLANGPDTFVAKDDRIIGNPPIIVYQKESRDWT